MADHKHANIKSEVSREDNKNIVITYTLPQEEIIKTRSEVLKEIAKDTTVPGFRKGMAPISKVEERVDQNKLVEHILSHLLPHAFADSVEEHHLKPAIYPKFEAVTVDSNSDWVIKATTCEIPEVILGDYKKKVAGELRSLKLTVNDKDTKTTKPSDDQVITALLKSVDVVVPQILIEEEVNGRLSQLLARIEKLGLTLEGYLASIKEDSNTLRDKYTQQAKEAIILEVALNKISEEEKIVVTDKEVDQFIVSTGSDPSKVQKEQKDTLIRVIQRRKALEILANLQ